MTKHKIVSILGAIAMLAPTGMAFASVDNVLFDNGTGNVTTSSGSNINLRVYVTGSTDVESMFVTFPGAGGAAEQGVCYNVDDQIGTAPTNGWVFNFSVKAPVNAGIWPIVISTYGVNGDGADQGCITGADQTQTFNNRVTVETSNSNGNATGNSGGSSSNNLPSWAQDFQNQLTALLAAIAKLTAAPVKDCPPAVGSVGVLGLQSWLVSHGYMTDAQVATGPGIYGPKTTAANMLAASGCNK